MILSINIPDDIAQRVVYALSELEGYTVSGMTEPRATVAKRRVIRKIKEDVRDFERLRETDALNIT